MSLILLFFQTRLAIKKIRCVVVEVLLFSIIYTLALFSRCSSQLSHKYVIHAGKRKLFSTLLFRLQLVVCVAKLNSKHNPSSIIKIVSQWRPFSFILYNLYDKQLRLVSECVSFGVRSGSSWASFSVYSPRNRRVVRPWARTAGWWGCRHTHYSWSSGDRRASGSPRVKARGSLPWWSFCTCCKT